MNINVIRPTIDLSGQPMPAAVLLAARARPEELSAMVIALLDEAGESKALLLEEEDLMVLGLLALAGVRRTELRQPFLRFLRSSEATIVRIFGEDWPDEAVRLLLSFYDGDDGALRALLLDPESPDEFRGVLFDALKQLTADGRADRAAFVDLLDQFDRENLAEPGDLAWMHWQDAVLAVGPFEFTERVRRGWEAGRVFAWDEPDQEDWLEQMRRREEGHAPETFCGEQTAIDDPVASGLWAERTGDDRDGPHLSFIERDWLDNTLLDAAAAGATMSLEEADGFFTAIHCGPSRRSFADCRAMVWRGKPDDNVFGRPEVGDAVRRLLEKHFNSIADRLASDEEPELILYTSSDQTGVLWAPGFMRGASLDQEAWKRLSESQRGQDALAHILMFIDDPETPDDEKLSSCARRRAASELPKIVRGIRRFWRNGPSALPNLRPDERENRPKIGRNEPCPCGSGKKYKKCCGAVI